MNVLGALLLIVSLALVAGMVTTLIVATRGFRLHSVARREGHARL